MGALTKLMMAGAAALGIAAGITGFAVYDWSIDDPAIRRAAKEDGRIEERQAWEELRRKAEIKAEQDRQKAQDAIDTAERLRLIQQAIYDQQIADLNATIDESDDDVSEAHNTLSSSRARRLRDSLDAVGRLSSEGR